MRFLLFVILLAIVGGGGYYFYDKLQTKTDRPVFEEVDEEIFGAWCMATNCYWFNDEGFVFEVAPRPEGRLIMVIDEIVSDKTVEVGDQIVASEHWVNLKAVADSWLFKDFLIKDFFVDNKKQETILITEKGLKFYFSLRFSPTNNLAAVKKISLQNLDYIDLRVENRVYYK